MAPTVPSTQEAKAKMTDAVNNHQEAAAAPVEYHNEAAGGKFPVIEMFGPTIQGEGIMVGIKTLFVRFGGCDFRCTKCDSMHAVEPRSVKANAGWLTAREIVEKVVQLGADYNPVTGYYIIHTNWVTLSGGNPAMWDLTEVVQELQLRGFKVAVETQGSIWRDWLAQCDCVTISPKGPGMGERFVEPTFRLFMDKLGHSNKRHFQGVCVKVVVFDQQDFEFAVGINQILEEYQTPAFVKYLSLGNSYPPELTPEYTMTNQERLHDGTPMVNALLNDYGVLLEDYLGDRRLREWKFLPQLHVLVWGNAPGV